MATEKPPIGVRPWWVIYPKRVVELSECITRYTNYSIAHTAVREIGEDYKAIRKWALEIASAAETMTKMAEEYKNGK